MSYPYCSGKSIDDGVGVATPLMYVSAPLFPLLAAASVAVVTAVPVNGVLMPFTRFTHDLVT